jgi:predicted  nucleic acid-binding Zn-ribbon protein
MLRIRHVFININTDQGVFGTRQDFHDGLNILRAENYAGKSQVVQSIMYALGMEGMQGPSHAVPLAHAMTEYLDYYVAGKKLNAKVSDSMVSIEIENGKQQFLTVQRAIAGERNRHLMTVYEGRAITKKEGLSTAHDYFVREGGATSSELGFHRLLRDFIGWDLPMAPRFNDVDCPLYLETIFPLLYVEQKLGWGRLPARYPTWLGIRDVARRTVEFLLGLDAYATALERIAVQDEIKRLKREWSAARSQAEKSASAVVGNVRGIPLEPVASWPPEVPPTLSVMQSAKWTLIADYLNGLRARYSDLQAIEVPSTVSAEPQIRAELAELEGTLAAQEHSVAALYEQFEADSAEAESLQQRIDGINDDLRKYKDLRKVRKLGSNDQPKVVSGHCPTCHQELADSLLDTSNRAMPMTVDQNVSFYEEQIQLFTAVHANAIHNIETAQKDLRAQRSEVTRLRDRIRDIRETLVSASGSPSIEAISERIRLQERIGRVETQQQIFEEHLAEFAELTSEWLEVQGRLKALPRGALSERDQKKLSILQDSFHQQLIQYKMGSLDVAEVRISPGNYEPEVAGVNLSADVSASDLIRLHWAYLLGLLEVGTQETGNHPGLLILDEPQQQSVEETSFREMLRHAAGEKNCQIIITTSHDRAIDDYLKQIGVKHLAEFGDDRILQKLSS